MCTGAYVTLEGYPYEKIALIWPWSLEVEEGTQVGKQDIDYTQDDWSNE
jgi:hypothetical protein